MTDGGALPEVADALLQYFAAGLGKEAEPSGEVQRITGRPARTFASWAADNADRFR